jgi:hypothetical protein
MTESQAQVRREQVNSNTRASGKFLRGLFPVYDGTCVEGSHISELDSSSCSFLVLRNFVSSGNES